jgi:predicted signal transduction protein with EAL and GGDEF domain
MHSNKDELFLSRLHHHPRLRERMETLLQVVENVAGDCTKADAAEQAVLEELRKLGNEALQGWAERAVQKTTETRRHEHPALQGNGKKKSGGIRSSGQSRS